MGRRDNAQRLRDIATSLRALPDDDWLGDYGWKDIAKSGAELLVDAVKIGAFGPGSPLAKLGIFIRRQRRENPKEWRVFVWWNTIAAIVPRLNPPYSRFEPYDSEEQAWPKACAPLADALVAEAERIEADAGMGEREAAPQLQEGPGESYQFQWQGQQYDLEIDPAAWRLLKVVWGKPMIKISEVGAKLRKGKRVKYSSLKPAVYRLNHAMNLARLPFTWGKDRGQDYIKYRGPTIASSVSP
jgi:hypothetical protein